MMLFDTHCHIADEAFDADREAAIDRFRAAGVLRALVVADPCEETPNQQAVFDLAARHDFLYAAAGVHPHNASRYTAEIEAGLGELIRRPKCLLWGEIGLDYHYDLSPRDVQREVFDRQLDLAYAAGKPVQLHIREAHGDCMDMLRARGRRPDALRHHALLHRQLGSGEGLPRPRAVHLAVRRGDVQKRTEARRSGAEYARRPAADRDGLPVHGTGAAARAA